MKNIGLYIHIPFCISKCIYCDFLSGPEDDMVKTDYIRALCIEMKDFADKHKDYIVSSVFLGGGTPSCISAELTGKIIGAIRDNFTLTGDCEITSECNPGTVDIYKLNVYKSLGINRLSFGLQSVNDEELKMLGRIHTFRDFMDSYEAARKCGFDNINVDVMSALPGQTIFSWKNTLRTVCRLNTEHISAYSLIIEEGTGLKKLIDDGVDFKLPDEDNEREMYYITNDILNSHGYDRYEISNHALKGHVCRHNILYWTGGEYAGIGIGAAGFIHGIRYTNSRDLKAYIANPLIDKTEEYSVSDTDAMAEFMYLGLRMCKGVSANEFRMKFGRQIENVYGPVIDRYVNLKLLERNGDCIRLTDAGIDVSNAVFTDFIL